MLSAIIRVQLVTPLMLHISECGQKPIPCQMFRQQIVEAHTLLAHWPNRAIDPIDGTVNFASGLDSFCVSVGVLRHATPLAGVVIEFVGGPVWQSRIYSASRNGGAFLNGARMSVSGVKDLADAVVVRGST